MSLSNIADFCILTFSLICAAYILTHKYSDGLNTVITYVLPFMLFVNEIPVILRLLPAPNFILLTATWVTCFLSWALQQIFKDFTQRNGKDFLPFLILQLFFYLTISYSDTMPIMILPLILIAIWGIVIFFPDTSKRRKLKYFVIKIR